MIGLPLRRILCAVVGLLAIPLAVLGQERPNFVFVQGEGQGWNSTSVRMDPDVPDSAHPFFRTPNLERLAADGVRFANYYAPSPRCTPSRATYLTGKSPAKLGMTFVTDRTGSNPRSLTPRALLELPVNETTIVELLRDSGYATAHFGKWHVGRRSPADHGFQRNDGANNNGGPENVPGPNPKQAYGITEKGIAFIREQAAESKPFYLQVSHYGGRGAADATPAANEEVRSWPRSGGTNERDLGAAAVIHDMDVTIGMILDELDKLGLSATTYVFYVADHGSPGRFNGPMTAGKGTVWEGGLRTPFLMRGPGVESGSVSRVRVTGMDLVPTVADLAGLADRLPDGVEGGSLKPILLRGAEEVDRPREEIVFHFPHYDFDPLGPATAMISGDRKMIRFYETDDLRLFDLAADPGERVDLAPSSPKEAAELEAVMDAYLDSVNAKLPVPNPEYDASLPNSGRERGGRRNRGEQRGRRSRR